MSDKKTLNINPDLFSFSKNTTRKKRDKNDPGGIKIKASPKKKNDTLKKKSILKMIRQHQEDRYKKLFEEDKSPIKSQSTDTQFNKEFQEARLFMENLTDKKAESDKIKNYTLRNKSYPNENINSLLLQPSMDPLQIVNPVGNSIINSSAMPLTLNPSAQIPKYGCLKNGTLPTYRNFMNQTRKQMPTPAPFNPYSNIPNLSTPILKGGNSNETKNENLAKTNAINAVSSIPIMGGKSDHVEQRINDSLSRIKQMNQTALKLQQMKKNAKPKKMKQKKTKRRTYKVGKSSVLPKISVLVSNKTIRNNISTQKQLLKQVNMQEIKSYLMKRGFIKVGSTAPNDVLRKMYESAIMICGEVQNHNPENLLYNYMNGGEA
jgi:hypothetical protein